MTQEIDSDALRAKYLEERDKRLREDGNDQYIEPSGRYAHFLDDPYVKPVKREPIFDTVEVAIIGAGFAGLATGARLKQAGISDIRLIEGGGDVGGVWYWNRYPGAMCDTAAMIYMPLLEETGHMPTQKYTLAPEIFKHAQRIASQFELYENALFSTQVTSLEWEDKSSRWIIRTNRGDALRARYVTMGTGPLHRPKLPGIPGIQEFEGHSFHTSRWDYEYTGGSSQGAPLSKLANKSVGIIGTGATAVQCIPQLARDSQNLFVFQRTPSSVDVRNNRPIDPKWFAKLPRGWQQAWLLNFAMLMEGRYTEEDLVKDGWTDISIRIRDRVAQALTSANAELGPDLIKRAYEASDDEKMNEIRKRVELLVKDPKTAEALKPWYRQLCKRPCFHDEYLQSFNLPSVKLVDTDGKGVERIDKEGVWVAGTHYKLDCLIYASGFEVGTQYCRRAGFETTGRNGVTLSERWKDGIQTLHGMHVHGFPNLFIVSPSQAAFLISNITHNVTDAAATIASILKHAKKTGACEIEVTKQAEQAWVKIIENGPATFLNNPDCTPGYYNNEGKPFGIVQRRAGGYPDGPVAFFEYINAWRECGDFKGLVFNAALGCAEENDE